MDLSIIATATFNKIVLVNSKVLGRGAFGTVFQGEYGEEKKPAAIKRIQLYDVKNNDEEALLQLKHLNVIELFGFLDDTQFRYYAMELCQASLDKVYLENGNPDKYQGPMPPLGDIFLQLAKGLEYIHENQLIHRDLKPANVLIWVDPVSFGDPTNQNKQVLMKWADFGLCKKTTESGKYTLTSCKGTYSWFAPELLILFKGYNNIPNGQPLSRGTNKSDVFSAGLVFGYVLLGGKHPYKSDEKIIEGDPENLKNIIHSENNWMKCVVLKMLENNPENRLTAKQVVAICNCTKISTLKTLTTTRKISENCIQDKIKEGWIKILSKGQPNIYSLYISPEEVIGKGFRFLRVSVPSCISIPRCIFFRNQSITHKVIILIGSVGCGKSRLINGMANYILGVQFRDPYRFQIVLKDHASSITAYTLYHQDGITKVPYSITIIDTPTYGDTQHGLKDEKITQSIQGLLKNQIFNIHAVCFVLASGETRLTDSQLNMFQSVSSILKEKIILNNVRLLVNFADNCDHWNPLIVEAFQAAPINTQWKNIPYISFICSPVLYAQNKEDGRKCYLKSLWNKEEQDFSTFFCYLNKIDGIIPVLNLTLKELDSEVDTMIKYINSNNPSPITDKIYISKKNNLNLLLNEYQTERLSQP